VHTFSSQLISKLISWLDGLPLDEDAAGVERREIGKRYPSPHPNPIREFGGASWFGPQLRPATGLWCIFELERTQFGDKKFIFADVVSSLTTV